MGTTDPAVFDWVAFIVLPSIVGLATIVIAVAAVVIAVQANARSAAAVERQARSDFARVFLDYTKNPTYESAMQVKWPEAMMDDKAVSRIPRWYQEQLSDSRVAKVLLETSVEMRLIEWVKTGTFNGEPIMSADGLSASL